MRELKLLCLDKIIEKEEHDNNLSIKLAENRINIGFWTVAIAIDSLTYGIMDGHHRLNAAKHIGLKRIPCIVMDYENGGVRVFSWRDNITCSASTIRLMVRNSARYPMKTTRHLFNPSIEEIKVPLGLLY